MATCLYAGTTILEIGATSTAFPYHSYTSAVSGATWYYTPWYTKNGYWYSGSSSTSTSGFASTKTVNAGYWLATAKGGTSNVQATAGNCYTVTVAAGANGTATGGGTVLSGGSVTATATPNAHYAFTAWSDGNTTAARTVTNVTADATLTASFAQDEWRLYAATESSTKGTVALSGWTTGSYFEAGVTKSATATPKTGYRFLGWYRTGQTLPDYSTETAGLLTYSGADTTYTAKFAATKFALTVSAGAGGAAASTPASGTMVEEGTVVTITATPAYNYVFASWSGISGAGADYSFYMPSVAVSTTANFTVRPSFAIAVTKENGTLGTVALTSATAPSVAETEGAISATGYTNVKYTLTATVSDTVFNMFSGWYSGETLVSSELAYTFTLTAAAAVSLVAKFAARPAYTIETRVSDGSATSWNIGNAAYDAGCRIQTDRAIDLQTPDRWLAGSITFTAAAASGWQIAGWYIADADGVATGTLVDSGENPVTFTLAYNAVVTANFTRIPQTATAALQPYGDPRGDASVAYGGVSGASVSVPYGESAEFSATADAGYIFAGWFAGYPDATPISTANPYSVAVTANTTLMAKFKATVTVTAAHGGTADSTGTVNIALNTGNVPTNPGATDSRQVLVMWGVTIYAIGTAGSVFDAWYLTSDTGFENPLSGYSAEQNILTVTENMALTARFVGASDIETRYLAILNYDNNEAEYSPLLGILASSGGTEITQSAWEEFTGTPASTGSGTAGNKFYTFTGSVSTTLSALPNSALGFLQWRSSYLIPIVPTPETGNPQFTASSPVVIGTSPSITFVTNRHYIVTADWGAPVAVDVSVRYADGCDESNGGFTVTPVTAERIAVQGGVTDQYVQGSAVTMTADVGNGYEFAGWYYDRAATSLASALPSFTHTVIAPAEFYAKFKQDSDAIYLWEGGTENKKFFWRSKRYKATNPFNPAAAMVYGDAYPVTLNLYMSSSPDAPATTVATVAVAARNQNGFRLPAARSEKYLEIEVGSTADVSEVTVSTSMGGLSQ